MELRKKHFKLYKSGKKWCVMALACGLVSIGLVGTASADTSEPTSTTEQVVLKNDNGQGQEGLANNKDLAATTPKSDTPTQEQQAPIQNGWIQNKENNQWTFYKDGKVNQGRTYSYLPTINGKGNSWYLTDNGVAQSGVQQWAGTYYYFNPSTYLRVDNDYVQSQWGMWYLFGNDGTIQTKVQKWAGSYYYFDPSTYLRVDNDYRQSQWGLWYMFGRDGKIATKVYQWAGTYYYFDPSTYLRVNNDYRQSQWGDWYMFGHDGRIVSGVYQWAGTYYYFDPTTHSRVDNDYRQSQWGDWYMFGPDGRIVTGLWNWMGSTYYFDPSTYLKVTNRYLAINGETHYFNPQGIMQDDPLVARWKSIINGFGGHHIMVALQSQKDGVVHEYSNTPGLRFPTASTVKVAVLAQLLHNTNGNLTGYQQELATRMIRNSDNNATDTLVDKYLGGTSAMQAIYSALGMTQTTPGEGNHWGRTQTTATDQLKLLNEIYIKPQSSYLNDQSRNYIKSLMSTVSPSQNWGISAGSNQFYVKNGWVAYAPAWTWYVSSIGFIPQGGNNGYSMAVYTDNNVPMQTGVNIIESLARASKGYI